MGYNITMCGNIKKPGVSVNVVNQIVPLVCEVVTKTIVTWESHDKNKYRM